MKLALAATGMLCCLCAAACSGRGELRCENPARYAASDSVPPLRIPGDLTPPDETSGLVIPPAGGPAPAEGPADTARCLEMPPDYVGGVPTDPGAP
jgi:hypothetical protein